MRGKLPTGKGKASMKAKELIDILSRATPDAEVILQKDAEGNGYSPLRGADLDAVYVPDSSHGGDVYSMNWTADDACKTDSEWAKIQAQKRCVVLFPIN
jgi:hypothetical protein